jgi:hypothetical protein
LAVTFKNQIQPKAKHELMKNSIHFTIIILLLTLSGTLSAFAQSTPEELGERLFDLFKDRLSDFSMVLPTMSQLQEKVQVMTAVPLQNRLEAFSKEYPPSVKRFNELCTGILEKGKETGIRWKRIKLKSIKTYPQIISIPYSDQVATVKFTKLSIYFTFRHRAFILIADAVMNFDGHYLISDDMLEFSEIATNTWYQP